MVFPVAAEWTNWCLLSPQFFGSGAARNVQSIVVEWQCHNSEVSHPGTEEECGNLSSTHR